MPSFNFVQMELGLDPHSNELVEVSLTDDFINDGGLGEGHYHVNGYPDGCMICDSEVEKYFNLYNCECDNCVEPLRNNITEGGNQ